MMYTRLVGVKKIKKVFNYLFYKDCVDFIKENVYNITIKLVYKIRKPRNGFIGLDEENL